MGIATAIGSFVPVWPFFVFSRKTSLILASIGCLVVAAWIGYEKRMGPRGHLQSYLTLVGAAALTLLIVGFIPQSSP